MQLRRFAACGFLGGVAGAAAIVLFSFVLFYSGISARFGVESPINISPVFYVVIRGLGARRTVGAAVEPIDHVATTLDRWRRVS